MFKDYALCSQEELEEKRQILEYLKDDLKYLSILGGGFLEKKLEIVYLQGEILESEWAIATKEAGALSYIRYRTGRVLRHAISCLRHLCLNSVFYIRHLIFRLKLWILY